MTIYVLDSKGERGTVYMHYSGLLIIVCGEGAFRDGERISIEVVPDAVKTPLEPSPGPDPFPSTLPGYEIDPGAS